jgi:hypothetical protein
MSKTNLILRPDTDFNLWVSVLIAYLKAIRDTKNENNNGCQKR